MRLEPEQRRNVIVIAAHRVATDKGLVGVTHGSVSKRCTVKTSTNTVRHYFNTRSDLWRAVIAHDAAFEDQGRELGL